MEAHSNSESSDESDIEEEVRSDQEFNSGENKENGVHVVALHLVAPGT